MAPLFQHPLRRRIDEAPQADPQAPDDEQARHERVEQQLRFLREQELRRARTSVPPPRRV